MPLVPRHLNSFSTYAETTGEATCSSSRDSYKAWHLRWLRKSLWQVLHFRKLDTNSLKLLARRERRWLLVMCLPGCLSSLLCFHQVAYIPLQRSWAPSEKADPGQRKLRTCVQSEQQSQGTFIKKWEIYGSKWLLHGRGLNERGQSLFLLVLMDSDSSNLLLEREFSEAFPRIENLSRYLILAIYTSVTQFYFLREAGP